MTVTAYADIRSRTEPVSTPQIVGEIER
jgi:hypothetical protein